MLLPGFFAASPSLFPGGTCSLLERAPGVFCRLLHNVFTPASGSHLLQGWFWFTGNSPIPTALTTWGEQATFHRTAPQAMHRAASWPGPLGFPGWVRHQSTVSCVPAFSLPRSQRRPFASAFSEMMEPLPHKDHGHTDSTAVSKKPLHLVFFFLKNIYVFIWLPWVLVAACGIFAASWEIFHCSA